MLNLKFLRLHRDYVAFPQDKNHEPVDKNDHNIYCANIDRVDENLFSLKELLDTDSETLSGMVFEQAKLQEKPQNDVRRRNSSNLGKSGSLMFEQYRYVQVRINLVQEGQSQLSSLISNPMQVR